MGGILDTVLIGISQQYTYLFFCFSRVHTYIPDFKNIFSFFIGKMKDPGINLKSGHTYSKIIYGFHNLRKCRL